MNEYLNVPFEMKTEDIGDNGTFKGYGSTFGGKKDSHQDVILKGAFKKTLEKGGRNGTGVAMLWSHDSRQPIGVWNVLVEDDKGLYVEGELVLDVQQAREAYALMKKKALRGLSIGWDYPRDDGGIPKKGSYEFDAVSGTRYIKEVELWEISPVAFPSNIGAKITAVKDGIEELEKVTTPRELERVLRDVYGLTNSVAKFVVKLARPSLREVEKKVDNGLVLLLANLKNVNANFLSK